MVNWVNQQVIKPLDIQALEADGRTGDFLIAKAAYSLRSLGTRQATLAATGDTVARADGKFVVQVRRSSDDALKSFTADEVTDGTLLAFVNEDVTIYQSDYSAGVNGWSDNSTITLAGNQDGVSDGLTSKDNVLKLTKAADSQGYMTRDQGVVAGLTYTVSGSFLAPASNTTVDGMLIKDGVAGSSLSDYPSGYLTSDGTWTDFSFSYTATADGTQRINFGTSSLGSNPNNSSTGSSGDIVYIADLKFVQTTSNGFVKTWYDQSVTNEAGDTATGNHAVQATAANQPKIVNAGTLLNELDFDGTSDELSIDFGADLSQANSFFMVHQSDTTTANSNDFFDRVSGSPRTLFDQSGNNYRMFSDSSADTGVAITTDKSLVFALYNGASSLFAKNGTATSALNAGTAGVNQNSSLGASNVSFYDGTIQEFIIYNSDQTDNRTAIEANIGEAYSITGIPAYDDEVDGFVETWYDQSGNGRDSTQATAARQPIIVDAGVFQDGLKFTHTDTTNGKILLVPRTAAELGQAFALVYVGKVTESDTSFNNLLGGLRGTQNYAAGSTGIAIKSSDGSVAFINETGTSSRTSSTSSTTTTLNEDFVAFATYEDAAAGPELTFQVDAGNQFFGLGSSYVTTSTKDIGIMNATAANGSYRTQESPTGICREVLVYDTHQGDNRVALVDNINNQYNLF
jgi:hypothetical protein